MIWRTVSSGIVSLFFLIISFYNSRQSYCSFNTSDSSSNPQPKPCWCKL